ncbi:MAG TPA: galactose-1-phosphate uridylyltransferase [Nitrospirota bacterium]|nr:galactose-1-phosphate uridylyltransferase [Nitrospirota bacterium]
MQNAEMRQDKVTRQWVIYAPSRGKRPKDFQHSEPERTPVPERDEGCPFCPGNEHMLPGLILESGGRAWQTRVVPNKYPALTPEGVLERRARGIYVAMGGFGRHEVVIETPLHNRDLGTMSAGEAAAVVETCHRRYRDLMALQKNAMAILFRNHGERAGTSLAHPHSQIIALGVTPHYIRWREEEAQHYFDEWGRCVFCDVLAEELRSGERMVMENGSFVAFVPFAAEVPFETWIMPREHKADFGDITDSEKEGLAGALRDVLGRMRERLGDPDYNYVVNTSARYRAGQPQFHWYVQIRPRLTERAGFEIGSGMSINPSSPEEDSALLRG